MTILEFCWPFLDHNEPYCKILDPFQPFQTNLGHIGAFWTILTILDKFWLVWTTLYQFGHFLIILNHFGLFWTNLNHFGLFLTMLQNFGPFWTLLHHVIVNPYQTTLDNFNIFPQFSTILQYFFEKRKRKEKMDNFELFGPILDPFGVFAWEILP